MSKEQLAAFIAKLKADAGLQQKLKSAGDLDAAVAIAKEIRFDVSKEDWLKHQPKQTMEVGDEDLGVVSGGALDDSYAPPPDNPFYEGRDMSDGY